MDFQLIFNCFSIHFQLIFPSIFPSGKINRAQLLPSSLFLDMVLLRNPAPPKILKLLILKSSFDARFMSISGCLWAISLPLRRFARARRAQRTCSRSPLLRPSSRCMRRTSTSSCTTCGACPSTRPSRAARTSGSTRGRRELSDLAL